MESREVGIGELLRHLSELFDKDAEQIYRNMNLGIEYRARYTPVIRAFDEEPLSISELQNRIRVTQGAISQTVKLMKSAGLLELKKSTDQRVSLVDLTDLGKKIKTKLAAEWELHIQVIKDLENEAGVSLRKALSEMIMLLDEKSYASRIEAMKKKSE